ncbi:hypothetical protein L1987_27546 [Smallanthus sonchifolius]|uniref:Uncharacterized protein n=1 Tax=Smallanthus sonchifolius TaxID=185202 RepID=A0ACB9ICV6_9ASTR|nr:hypothetical protein L1987_27546 [Smallanthus sonchifolius]
MENIESVEAQKIQDNIRSIFKDAFNRKVEALDKQVPKWVCMENEQNIVGQHQALMETGISKPVPTSAESTFTVHNPMDKYAPGMADEIA